MGRKEKKKSVRFVSENELFKISPNMCYHLEEKDIKTMWYQQNDYDSMWSDIMEIVRVSNQDDINFDELDPERYCIRGIERLILEERCMKQEEKPSVKQYLNILIILTEQKFQKQNGLFNPDSIRCISEEISLQSLKEATELAALDAIEAQSYALMI